ncbi:hypothetical protein MRX96_020559 [Rhipicephalus microplus]
MAADKGRGTNARCSIRPRNKEATSSRVCAPERAPSAAGASYTLITQLSSLRGPIQSGRPLVGRRSIEPARHSPRWALPRQQGGGPCNEDACGTPCRKRPPSPRVDMLSHQRDLQPLLAGAVPPVLTDSQALPAAIRVTMPVKISPQ